MTLSDATIDWFARQIVVPGIGAQGQEKLLAARIAVVGNSTGVKAAAEYAAAVGCDVVELTDRRTPSCVIAAGLDEVSEREHDRISTQGVPLVWYACAGSNLRCGVRTPGDPLPAVESTLRERTPRERILHRIAACDAVGTAACLILGWRAPHAYEVVLG